MTHEQGKINCKGILMKTRWLHELKLYALCKEEPWYADIHSRVTCAKVYQSLLSVDRFRTPKACKRSGQSERLRSACANQDAWAVLTPNRPKANSETFRRVTLKHARLTQQHVKGCIFCNTSLRPHYLSLAIVPFPLWDRLRNSSYPVPKSARWRALTMVSTFA